MRLSGQAVKSSIPCLSGLQAALSAASKLERATYPWVQNVLAANVLKYIEQHIDGECGSVSVCWSA